MSFHPSNRTCQWCSKGIVDQGERMECRHMICSQCVIGDTNCRSHCPCCWYQHAEQFIHRSKICAVCCRDLTIDRQPILCTEQHERCSECLDEGCILCQFHRLDLSKNIKYRDRPPRDQSVLYTCQIWQEKFEEMTKGSSAHSHSNGIIDREDQQQQFNSDSNRSQHRQSESQQQQQEEEEIGDCMICLERLDTSYQRLHACGHCFHQSCINQWFQSTGKQSCPNCGYVYGLSKGPQPANGQMSTRLIPNVLPGFEHEKYNHHEGPTIELVYSIPHGRQGPLNPKPGAPYYGTTRRAYLPNTKEGKEILALLKRAFDDQHVFTIGKSVTTGQDDVVTWNDIHHKTSIDGGPDRYGYPDPTYLYRIRQELADKGYK